MTAQAVTIEVGPDQQVSGLWLRPPAAAAVLVLAHGAGAGMTHRAMEATAEGLASRGVASLRYNFAYMERGSRRPDTPAVAHAAVRAAVEQAEDMAPDLPLFAGGRSFGGRMTSQAQAEAPLPGVRGLVFFAFPLHPPGKPGIERAEHLGKVSIPMLFLQGTRDEFAQADLLDQTISRLGDRASLHRVVDADHSFHVPAKTGLKDAQVLSEILDVAREWMSARASEV